MKQYIDRALYARGYIISRDDVALQLPTKGWLTKQFGSRNNIYYINYDERLDVYTSSRQNDFVMILGLVLDPVLETLNKACIAEKILDLKNNRDKLLDYFDELCGRFIVVYGDDQSACLIQDACGMKTCYYGEKYISSHYGLINDLERHPHIKFWESYCKIPSDKRPWYLPGDYTPYEKIFMLVPNHELKLNDHSVVRIFPRKVKQDVSASSVADYFAELLRKQVRVLSRQYKLLVSITAGNDSRVTLSAMRPIKDDILLFSYVHSSQFDSSDLDNIMSKYLADTFGLRLKLLELNKQVPTELETIIKRNHYHTHINKAIVKYLEELPLKGALHIRSNIFETIRSRKIFVSYGNTPEEVERMTYGGRGIDDEFVHKAYKEYFYRNEYDKLKGYHLGDIAFTEIRMGRWHSGGVLMGGDIAFDTYCLFNQRKLLDLGQSMPRIYRRSNYLVKEVVSRLWPELLVKIPNTNEYVVASRSTFSECYCSNIKRVEVVSSERDFHKIIDQDFVEFGFSSNAIRRDSYVEASWCFEKKCKGNIAEFMIRPYPNDGVRKAFEYEVLVNNRIVRTAMFDNADIPYQMIRLDNVDNNVVTVRLKVRKAGESPSAIVVRVSAMSSRAFVV